jgi:CheY-like chemotaxis protein
MDKSKVRVLAIDDTPINLHILAKVLDDDLEYFTATSGESGLELAAKIQPDLVLLDVLMPQMDGFEVCRRLKADPTLCHIPVIL